MPPVRRKITGLSMRQPKALKLRHDPLDRDVSSSRPRSEEMDHEEQEDIQGNIGFDLHTEETSDGEEQDIGEGPYDDSETEVSSQETYLSVAL